MLVSATLRFDGDDRLAFGYTIGTLAQTKQLTRLPSRHLITSSSGFGARRFACNASPFASRASADNYSDVWTGTASNAGWGMTLFHVDDQLFAGWYTYDADREPTFFIIATPSAGAGQSIDITGSPVRFNSSSTACGISRLRSFCVAPVRSLPRAIRSRSAVR